MSSSSLKELQSENKFSIQIPLNNGEPLKLKTFGAIVFIEKGLVLSRTYRQDGALESTAIFRGPTRLGRTFTGSTDPYHLKALEPCVVEVIDNNLFEGSIPSEFEAAEKHDQFYLALLVEALMRKNRSRRASVLAGVLDLTTVNGQFVTPKLTGEDLGNLAGVQTPFVYTTLKTFKSQGVIKSPEPHRYEITQLGRETVFHHPLPTLIRRDNDRYHPYQDHASKSDQLYKLVKGLQSDNKEVTLAWVFDLLTQGGDVPTPKLSLPEVGLISSLNRSRVWEILNLWIQKEFVYRSNGRNSYSYNLTESGKRALELIKQGSSSLLAHKLLND